MLQRANRSAAVLSVWGILTAGLSLLGTPTAARASDVSISFDEIESFSRTQSPRARVFEQELLKLEAERDDALQWSNPGLGYDREEGATNREWQITLSKSLVMPFSHSRRKDGWGDRILSTELRLDQASSNLLAELKAGYVRLRLLDAFLTRLNQLGEIVIEASAIAEARHSEGEISGLASHLIQLSAHSLDASRRIALQERGEMDARWRAEMGMPTGSNAVLVTPIGFQTVELASPSVYVDLLAGRPAIRSLETLERALGKQAAAAEPSLVPGIDAYIGFKRFGPVDEGFVAGIGLSLPLFDRNAAAARKYAAEQRILKNEHALFRARLVGEIETLVRLIEDTELALSTIPFQIDDAPLVMSNLLFSYQEGQLSLDEFLGAIQIEVTGFRDYFDLLSVYYENIFRLEAITGVKIVSSER